MSGARRILRLAPSLLLALAMACGGGGGGGGPTEPTPPPPPPAGIVFTPQAAGANSVSLATGAATGANTLFLEVRASSVADFYGAAFDLRYPSAVLQFVRATPGTFLDGATLQAVESSAGTVVIGISRLGAVPGAGGSGVLMTLELRATAAGTGAFSFAENSATDSAGRPLSGLTWAAGTVTVTR